MKRLFLIFSILVLIALLVTGITQKINSTRGSSRNEDMQLYT